MVDIVLHEFTSKSVLIPPVMKMAILLRHNMEYFGHVITIQEPDWSRLHPCRLCGH